MRIEIEPAELNRAAQIVRAGGAVVFPTETVYGLGANAMDAQACARIFEIKRRPRFNPLIAHIAEPDQLVQICSHVPAPLKTLAEAFWPGPLTLILPRHTGISELVTAGLPTVGVRIPRHPVAQRLLRQVGLPIAAPSANRFTRLSPTSVEHARAQLGHEVDHYLDGGPCEVGLESTILAWVDGKPVCLRPGGLDLTEIEAVIGPVERYLQHGARDAVLAPGMLAKHYSPLTPLELCVEPPALAEGSRYGLVTLKASTEQKRFFAKVEELSARGDLREAAARLFQSLQRLEAAGLEKIYATVLPETGLGIAINDRLRRAAAR